MLEKDPLHLHRQGDHREEEAGQGGGPPALGQEGEGQEKTGEELLGKEKSDDRHYMKRLLENTDGEVVDTESLLLILGQER